MKFISRVVPFLFVSIFHLTSLPSHGVSIAATGHVDAVNSTELRIIRPDGTTLNALKGTDPYVGFEFNAATVQRVAWGRASCSGGVCTWTCLDTVPECNSFFDVTFNGPVVAKDLCAGILYVTIDSGQGFIRSRCAGAQGYAECDALTMDQRVEAVITVGCGDGEWRSFR